jgi:hypothetical protein
MGNQKTTSGVRPQGRDDRDSPRFILQHSTPTKINATNGRILQDSNGGATLRYSIRWAYWMVCQKSSSGKKASKATIDLNTTNLSAVQAKAAKRKEGKRGQ